MNGASTSSPFSQRSDHKGLNGVKRHLNTMEPLVLVGDIASFNLSSPYVSRTE